jgi:hypothetical protein
MSKSRKRKLKKEAARRKKEQKMNKENNVNKKAVSETQQVNKKTQDLKTIEADAKSDIQKSEKSKEKLALEKEQQKQASINRLSKIEPVPNMKCNTCNSNEINKGNTFKSNKNGFISDKDGNFIKDTNKKPFWCSQCNSYEG